MSTKTLASLLIVTSMALVPGVTRKGPVAKASRYQRLIQRHDRKAEMRAALLGISSMEFRELQATLSMDEIAKRYGLRGEADFRQALLAKLRSELRQRGWTSARIQRLVSQ